MKIKTTAEDLAEALRCHVTEKRSTIPILEMARVKGNRVITTNLDLFSIAEIDADLTDEPDFLIPCRQVFALVDGQTGPLVMEYIAAGKGSKAQPRVRIVHGGCTFLFNSAALANFPVIPETPLLSGELDGKKFKTMIEWVFFSISNEESRYAINGALFKADNEKITMVATDGHRLSLVGMDGDAPPTSALFSRSSLKWMKENVGEWAALGIGTDYNVICSARKTLLFRKLTGQFPKYEKVIPKSSEVTVTATFPSIRELRSTLSRVAKCADEASGCVQWQFGLNPKIATKSVNRGSASAPLDCKVEGELTISWCNSYITDLLSIVEDGELTIQMKDAQSASLFQLDGVKYIVMPIRAFKGEDL